MTLSIIIPIYNEEATVLKLIGKVKKVRLGKIKKEIIVINDGSIDRTAKLLRGVKNIKIINHSRNKGKGAAVRTGLAKSSGGLIVVQDADLEYDPNDYIKLLKPIIQGKAEVVYGSRLKNYPLVILGEQKTPMPFHLIANKVLTFITNLLYHSKLTDMETCYKAFTRDAVQSIKLVSNGFEIEPELTAKLLRKGFKIHEISIKVSPRSYEEGKKINWQDGFKAIYYLVYYRLFD
ncbi:MAG: Glycosyltransferase, group 2 family [Candidatus Woesebacteria bacterium GW2011_GWB1_38_5b]|uniref:Glycosyltransferase, group 2 family n=1 Tax=Candidatus Woesebacteria bacterium GW2011_GWB1_38_5b TaxID=1618569 RepID=A0A0G0NF32_9BACT|nr:MAG: Glycosyltransferase, group 2 family [Candidatus Woesebacteria bacterium GW2011_GWB1_38_5b]